MPNKPKRKIRTTQASRKFSAEVIRYLRQTRSLTSIAELLDVSRPYICMVSNGQRSLTIEHLLTIENELGEGVAALVLEAILSKKSNKTRAKYEGLLQLLRDSSELRASLIESRQRRKR